MQKLNSIQINPPADDLITLTEAKRHLRRDDDDDNGQIDLLVAAAIDQLDGVSGILGRALVAQDWVDVASGFPASNRLDLALTPVMSVLAIKYFDGSGQEITIPEDQYSLHHDFRGSYIRLKQGVSWPATKDRDDAVSVEYRAGYGENAANVPAVIRLAALELVAHWYDNREAVVVGTIASQTPMNFKFKLRRFIRPHF